MRGLWAQTSPLTRFTIRRIRGVGCGSIARRSPARPRGRAGLCRVTATGCGRSRGRCRGTQGRYRDGRCVVIVDRVKHSCPGGRNIAYAPLAWRHLREDVSAHHEISCFVFPGIDEHAKDLWIGSHRSGPIGRRRNPAEGDCARHNFLLAGAVLRLADWAIAVRLLVDVGRAHAGHA